MKIFRLIKPIVFCRRLVFCCGMVFCGGTADAQLLSNRGILFDANWKFSMNDTVGADRSAFDDQSWRVLNLPHDWSIESAFLENAPTGGGGGYLPTGIGWYRKHFMLRETELRKAVWIEFDGVYQNSDVWINGHHLGHYPNGYMSFYYELGGYIKKGENIITVRVDNSLQPNTRYYSGSGIYRHVWLHVTDRLHIAQWGVYASTTHIDSAVSRVAVKTSIVNDRKDAGGHSGLRQGVLRTIIVDGGGHAVASADTAVSFRAGESIEIKQALLVAKPLLWSLERPDMYTVVSMVMGTTDSVFTPFGFRDIGYDADRGFLLNGKPVKMHGVCLHHDAGSVGAAVPDAVWARRLQLLKDMGCNAIRTSHNPVSPEFLGLCDRMGFLVMDEFLDEWKSGKVKYGYSQYFDEWSQHDLVGFIRRDRNHPSIVMWSAGNEIGEQKQEKGVDILIPLISTFHREDPTRPVTTGNDNIAADNGSARLSFLEALDIVGYNYVDRWHERRELFYDIDRHDHPHWKFVGTESVNIADSRGNYFGGNFFKTDSSMIRPANMPGVIRAEQLWKYVDVHDFVIGDFMWTGIDYLGEARWPSKNASSGVIDLCGFPKDAFYFYQSQWTQQPMIHLSPHWNWRGREGKVIQVMAYTNCDSVELFLNGRSFGIKAVEFPRQGNSGGWNRYARPAVGVTTGDLHLIWDVPYAAGVLRAVGRRAGRVVCEEEIRTTEGVAAVRLSADRDAIAVGAEGIVQVKVEAVDRNGTVVPDAGNLIQFSVEGNGQLIGLDNGDPKDHTSMKSHERRVFNGLALAIIQSNGRAGTIRVRAESAGLKGSELVISAGPASASKAESSKPGWSNAGSSKAELDSDRSVPESAHESAIGDRPKEIFLWPGGAPGSEGKTGQEKIRIAEGGDHVISGINKPSITPYLPASSGGLTAVIVAPGGGHVELWIDHEGYNPAAWLKEKGIAAFVLKYRLAREPNSGYTVDGDAVPDMQRAIRLVRSHAKEWGIDPSRIGVMGFSAGGEVAALSAMRSDSGHADADDPVERFGCRPDFQALIYPGGTGRFEAVSGEPPVFLAGGYKDRPDIAEGLARLYLKYKTAGIPAELHIYADVGHGFGMRASNKGAVAGWPERFVEWLAEMGR